MPVNPDLVTSHKKNTDSYASHSSGRRKLQPLVAVLAALALVGFAATPIIGSAHANVITPEEHWRYEVHWYWDTDEREMVGLITPTIVIENETSDMLEGYIADANGTRLDMYDGEQVVKARYGYNGWMVSDWELASWINDGYFKIEIPQKYRDADFIGLYIGNDDYSIDDGDINTKNLEVSINSVRMDYELGNSTLVSVAAVVEEEEPVGDGDGVEIESVAKESSPSSGSLIDMILAKFGML